MTELINDNHFNISNKLLIPPNEHIEWAINIINNYKDIGSHIASEVHFAGFPNGKIYKYSLIEDRWV